MLVIRKEQIAAFEASLRERFESRMADHLTTYFPLESGRLGPELRAFIRRNIDKAFQYGIDAEHDVCIYLDLAMAYGAQFDEVLPWSRNILNDPALGAPAKIERLLETALPETAERPVDE
jgi:hypothetical protein